MNKKNSSAKPVRSNSPEVWDFGKTVKPIVSLDRLSALKALRHSLQRQRQLAQEADLLNRRMTHLLSHLTENLNMDSDRIPLDDNDAMNRLVRKTERDYIRRAQFEFNRRLDERPSSPARAVMPFAGPADPADSPVQGHDVPGREVADQLRPQTDRIRTQTT